jgi:excisionase family DNA binding protein
MAEIEVLSIQQVSDMVGISYHVIRRQIERGRLKAYKFSANHVRIMKPDVYEWLERSVHKPKAQPVAAVPNAQPEKSDPWAEYQAKEGNAR